MPEQEVIINYKDGQDTYEVKLIGKNLDAFKNTDKKQGEALVAALVAGGDVTNIARWKNGLRNDGMNGEAADQIFNDGDILVAATHCKDGKFNDAANGGAAIQRFNDDGKLIYLAYCTGDKRNDGANGEPAIQRFDPDSGKLTFAARYKDGKLVKELTPQEIADYSEQLKSQAAKRAKTAGSSPRIR